MRFWGVVLVAIIAMAGPARAETYEQLKKWCYGKATDEQSLHGCAAVIAADREAKTDIAVALLNRSLAFRNIGEIDRAIADLYRAVELRPIFPEALSARAGLRSAKGDLTRALQDYDLAIRQQPTFEDAIHNRGTVRAALKDYDRAIADYDLAIKLAPRDPFPYSSRGNAWFNKGEVQRALQDYTRALVLKPDHLPALYNRGRVYATLGAYERALADFTAALAVKEDFDTLMSRAFLRLLRQKVDDNPDRPLIHTIRGIGYCLRAPG